MVSLATVYLDESGTHASSSIVTVAGFLSNVDKWATFSNDWNEALRASNIRCFHMTDFENRRGEFDGWTEDIRKPLLNKLLTIIQEHTFWSVGSNIETSLYDSLLGIEAKKLCGGAYGAVALHCWRLFGEKLKIIDGWMNCIMESGAKGFGAIQLIYSEDSHFPEWSNDHRILSLSIDNKINSPPLQAADILAYEIWKERTRILNREPRKMRYPYKILAKVPHTWVYLDEIKLQEFNDDVNRQISEFYKHQS
jgi:hypothetical protein